jgi:5'-phosphate synthase pdxT subunit
MVELKIGVLALQGGVTEHINHIEMLNQNAVEIKNPDDLKDIDALIIPGGESTTMGKLLKAADMLDPLRKKITDGLPTWGTCAGMILLADSIENSSQRYLGVIDITVRRNAYGSQIESFCEEAYIPEVSSSKIPLVFIRAPYITHIGKDVKGLCSISGKTVAARWKNILVTAFHPELTENLEFHKYFLSMI